MDISKRPNRHSNPSKNNKRGRGRFIRRKRRETKELSKAVL